MVLSTSTGALGAMTGPRYLESLRDGRDEWLDGNESTTSPRIRLSAAWSGRSPRSMTSKLASTAMR
jgi:hypothetical protein